MEHDASDILGQSGFPVAHGKNSGTSFSMGQWIFIGVVLFVVYMVAKRLWKRALVWQEQSYKLATRRRHGIPDNDLRPFNVAYSAAMTRAREEESRAHVKSNPLLHPQGRLLDRHDTQSEQTLRNRTVPGQKSGAHLETVIVPGPMAFKPTSSSNSSAANPKFLNHYVPRQPISHSAQASSSTSAAKPLTRQPTYRHPEDLTSDNEGKKRSLDEQDDSEHEFKKSRLDGEELIDGDDDAEFYDMGDTAPKRGSKRGFGEEEEEESEEVSETKKFRGKRARKVSQEKIRQSHVTNDNMDIDDEELDEVTELRSRACGKKRDRTEAGSTFGGDDEDSAVELEPEDDIKARRRRRKRQTVSKRKSEASHARGKKRDRDSDDEKSDQESEDASHGKISRKKRGKRGSDRHDKDHASRSDISMDESIRGKVRVIGEEWESNGIKYKVGLNGQRLRQALVKQARQKFVMPIDSQHPDRNANVQICMECWLTEEEYQEKKAKHMLAWQDGTPLKQDSLNNLSLDITEPQLSQGVAGKNLLWGSSTASTPAASPPSRSPTETPPESAKPKSYRDTYRHSIATTVGLPISPFHNSQIPPVKRIASTTRTSLSVLNGPPGLPDSTKGNPRTANKTFSKWEKQELEAQAIMKMREANRKKELEREAKLKEEREKTERAAAERARLEKERLERERAEKERTEKEKAEAERKAKEAAQVPKITVTAPSSENVTAPATSTSTSLPNFFSKAPTGSTTAKPAVNTATSGSTSFFSNTSTSASIPAANLAQAEPSKPQSPFSFSTPSGNSNTGNVVTSSPAFRSNAFSFPTTTPSTGGPKTEGSTQSPFSSLSSRIGTLAPAPAPESSNPPPAQPTLQPASFNTFPAAKPNNSMISNRSQTASAQPNPPATTSSSTNAPLKFTFNVPSKSATPNSPAAASTTALPSSSSSSLTGALGSDQQKTTSSTSTFNFKIPTTPASVSNSANITSTTPTAATTSPKFNFGTSSTFNSSASSSGSDEQKKDPFKSSFGNMNTASTNIGTGSSPFGGSDEQKKDPFKSSFGNMNTASANIGTGSSPFGGNTTFQGQSFQSSFGRNPLGANTSASQGQKSAFDGGNTNTTTTFSDNSVTGPSPFGANFAAGQGQKSAFGRTNTTTVFSNNTAASPSLFGIQQTQTPNVFGGGVFGSNSTEAPKSVVFGNGTSTSTSTTSAPSANTGNNTTTTPKFSFPVNNPTSTPAATTSTANGTPVSGSGFTFSFGQTPTTTTTTTTPQSSPFGSSAFGNTAAAGTSSSNTTTKPSIFGGVFGAPASQEQK